MTHAWPQTDTFDAGTPNYDSGFLNAYIRTRNVTTDPAFASSGSGYGLSTFFSNAHQLYDGWTGAANTLPGSSNLIGGWLWRVALASGAVEASIGITLFSPSAASIVNANPRRHHCGVGVRIQGGTLTSGGTTSAYIDAPSGYYAVCLYDVGLDGCFEIWRVDSGTIARLAQTPVPPSVRTWASLSPLTPRELKLICRTNGSGNVELELWTNATRGGAVTQVLTAVDSSVSKLTSAGRAGFFASLERTVSGVTAAPVLQFFSAGPEGGPADFRDEWERHDRTAALATSGALLAGRVLTSSFYGDLWGASGTGSILQANVAANRVSVSTSSSALDRFFLSQRSASDPFAQDREATIRFAGGTTIPNPCLRKIGVCVRTLMRSPTSNPELAYLAYAMRDDQAGTGSVRLVRISGSGTMELGILTGVTLALNTEYRLRLIVENDAVPSPFTGNVKLRVYLDSAQLALVSQGIPGVSINGVGTVTDASSDRIQEGDGEGLYFAGPSGSNRNMACALWDVGGVLAPVFVRDEDHETISLDGEADGATGTFPYPLSYPIEKTLTLERPIEHDFEADYKFKGALSDSIRTQWRGSVKVASETDRDAVKEFIDEHKGAEKPFDWTPRGYSAPIKVRFLEETSSEASPAPDFFVFDPVLLEEVFP